MTVWTTTMPSPCGELRLFASEVGIRALIWPQSDLDQVGMDEPPIVDSRYPWLAQAVNQVQEYFDLKRRNFDLPLDPIGTAFQLKAWRALVQIPYGETRTYGQQAASIGKPNAARAIGGANNKNPISLIVP